MKKKFKRTALAFLSSIVAVSATFSMYSVNVTAETALPNPVISRDCPAYSESSPHTAKAANDAAYYSFWYGNTPDYLAYDLSAIPESQRQTIIAVWYNTTGQYDYTVVNGGSSSSMPTDYTIEVNAAPGGTYPTDGWATMDTVTGNTLHSRQHLIDFSGYNWIRIVITGADGKAGGTAGINFDIHNVSDGVSDSWIFFGDSITACGMMNCYGTGFAELVNKIDSRYFPVQENGGIGGIRSTDGVKNIDRWLDTFPGEYVSIAYGTNDAWGNQTGAEKYYDNTVYMIEEVLKYGKTPIVPKIPYATEKGINTYLADYNAMIDKIYENYPQVIKGPDFYEMFYNNPEYLSADGVHPNDQGYAAMRELWAETMYSEVYSAVETDLILGDINNDGKADSQDEELLSDYLVGKDKLDYPNADKTADLNCDGSVDVFDLMILRKIAE